MAPHLTDEELDVIHTKMYQRWSRHAILNEITQMRKARCVEPPQIWAIRRAMRGCTHKRCRVETRGRRPALTEKQGQRLDVARQKLVRKADGEYEVTYAALLKSARVSVHRSTASRYLGPDVRWRRMREKPPRTAAHIASRAQICAAWRKRPKDFWTKRVDLIIDNKRFAVPCSQAARKRLRQQAVRGVLRKRSEGVAPGCTKPSKQKHKFNAGGYVSILAGICCDRIALWEEVRGRWTSAEAARMYAGPIRQTLQKRRPGKRS